MGYTHSWRRGADDFTQLKTLDVRVLASLLETIVLEELALTEITTLCAEYGIASVRFPLKDRRIWASVLEESRACRGAALRRSELIVRYYLHLARNCNVSSRFVNGGTMILDRLRKHIPKAMGSQIGRSGTDDALSFQAIGIELDDLEIAFANTDSGEVEVDLSDEGFRIVQAAAHRLKLTPEELIHRALTLAVDPR